MRTKPTFPILMTPTSSPILNLSPSIRILSSTRIASPIRVISPIRRVVCETIRTIFHLSASTFPQRIRIPPTQIFLCPESRLHFLIRVSLLIVRLINQSQCRVVIGRSRDLRRALPTRSSLEDPGRQGSIDREDLETKHL